MTSTPSAPDWAETAINVASPRLGTTAVRCSDDFFAPMSRMLDDSRPVFKPDVFDDNGKWMDGWESRRRRDDGHDWCVIKLGVRATIRGVNIDTSHFTGNYPPMASLWAADGDDEPDDSAWHELIPASNLGPSAQHFLRTPKHAGSDEPWRWLRLNIFPDGGVARLRVYGDPVPTWDEAQIVELSAIENGGRVVGYNDAHYGDVWAILTKGRGVTMGDGWETRRRRGPGHDWLIIELGAPGTVERIEVDTAHFKGNYPDRCSIQGVLIDEPESEAVSVGQADSWPELMSEQPLSADTIHTFEGNALETLGPISHLKLNIHPDGGVSRLRVWGRRS